MTTPTVDDLQDSEIFTPDPPHSDNGDIKFLDADIGEFIKRPKTAMAREYEKKTQSALNTVMRFCVQSERTVPDAAAVIAYGDDFAAAVGDCADISKTLRQGIDIILSPESPWLALAIAGLPLATQLIRNHQTELTAMQNGLKQRPDKATRKAMRVESRANRPKIHFKLGKRQFEISVPVKLKLTFLMAQTVEPKKLEHGVFNNEQVVKALKKRGINVAGHTL
jgi:hypothetical protein